MHDVRPRESIDRAAFIITFLAGIAGGIVLKVAGLHPFVSAAYAALVLVGYAYVAWSRGSLKIEPEAIGDNCYYLGFLFTLSSLGFTLYQMADPSPNSGHVVDIPQVISGFGVALSSTIVGVFLRVLMMQMRPDFVAKDREVRADINRSFMDFRKNMSGMLSHMKAFAVESVQVTAERDERIRVSTEQFVKDHQKALTKSTAGMTASITSALTDGLEKLTTELSAQLTDERKASLIALQDSNKEMQVHLKATLKDIMDLKDRLIEQESQTFEEIQARRKRVVIDLERAETALNNHNVEMERFIKITRRSADAMTKRLVPGLDGVLERLEKQSSEPVEQPEPALSEALIVEKRPTTDVPPQETAKSIPTQGQLVVEGGTAFPGRRPGPWGTGKEGN
jgi:hypothetical protein